MVYLKGSSLGILYELPKHMFHPQIRPILSAFNTYNYRLAKFLVAIILLFATNNYTLKNSFEFKDSLSFGKYLEKKLFIISFDIESLFTTIPTDDAMNILINTIFNSMDELHGFSKQEFKNSLFLATSDKHFFFDNKLYFEN